MTNINECMTNDTVMKLGRGLKEIRKNQNSNNLFGNKLYLDIKCNVRDRVDRMHRFISELADAYYRSFNEYLLTEEEYNFLVNFITENKANISVLKNTIIAMSVVG